MSDGGAVQRMRRWTWDLQRFGLGPNDLLRRMRPAPDLPRILCVTLPKAGTHLLERLLCRHPSLHRRLLPTLHDSNIARYGGLEQVLATTRPGQLLMAHLAHLEDYSRLVTEGGPRGVFMIRDPRDIAVSLAFYLVREQEHPFHELFQRQPSVEERIRLAIHGSVEEGYPSMAQRLREYRGWLGGPGGQMMTVRFEDLIGARGGGGSDRQKEVVAAILDHLEVGYSEELLERLCEETFSEVSPTFRAGRIGGYRRHFEGSDLEEECRQSFGAEMQEYGYT